MKHVPSVSVALPVAVLLTACLFVPSARAQVAAAGAILGTVTDASGAIVPDAEVTATNEGTQQSRTVQTNAQGFYSIESLLAAKYDVTVKKTGFQTYAAQNVTVDAGLRVQVNV